MVSLNIYKNSTNNFGWTTGYEIEGQAQSRKKLIGILTVLRPIFSPNLEILTSNGGVLLHRQAQNRVNFDFC